MKSQVGIEHHTVAANEVDCRRGLLQRHNRLFARQGRPSAIPLPRLLPHVSSCPSPSHTWARHTPATCATGRGFILAPAGPPGVIDSTTTIGGRLRAARAKLVADLDWDTWYKLEVVGPLGRSGSSSSACGRRWVRRQPDEHDGEPGGGAGQGLLPHRRPLSADASFGIASHRRGAGL